MMNIVMDMSMYYLEAIPVEIDSKMVFFVESGCDDVVFAHL